MKFIRTIKADKNYTEVIKKGYTYDQLSEEAKSNVRSWLAEDQAEYWYENIFSQDIDYILEKYKEYTISSSDLDISWDSYGNCKVDLDKKRNWWPAFKNVFVECAKQVLKDLPTFQNDPELLEDWSAEAASDMYYDGNGIFETYAGLNDLDGHDGYGLSYKISDLCSDAYESQVRPVLNNIEQDIQKSADDWEEYVYSEEYAKETCEANEYLFDENGRLL